MSHVMGGMRRVGSVTQCPTRTNLKADFSITDVLSSLIYTTNSVGV